MENPIPPAEPAEPVIKGSMAIGCTSLAVVKTAATTSEVPLYLHIALMKHNQVCIKSLIFSSDCHTFPNFCSRKLYHTDE